MANTSTERRAARVRRAVRKAAKGRLRLSVFRSSKHIYAQVIDDTGSRTVAAPSSLDKGLREKLKTGSDAAAAGEVGKLVDERAIAAGNSEAGFDRGPYLCHGRVKDLAAG